MKNQLDRRLFLFVAFLTLPVFTLHAQLVADGATVTFNGIVTNITGNLTVGTNGSFTSLITHSHFDHHFNCGD